MEKTILDKEKRALDFYIRMGFKYAVRNKDSRSVRFYSDMPERKETTWNSLGHFITMTKDLFKQVKWKDDPIDLLELKKQYE